MLEKPFYPLEEYWAGRVVAKLDDKAVIGHIVSFYKTNHDELGLNVLWIDGTQSGIHHANVIFIEDAHHG